MKHSTVPSLDLFTPVSHRTSSPATRPAAHALRTSVTAAAFAAAVALLLLLPALSQSTFDRTDGKISTGGLSVGVFENIEDAQLAKNREATYEEADGTRTTVYLPALTPPTAPTLGSVASSLSTNDTAYLANGLASPQQTFFNHNLYVSNNSEAYHTLLITVESTSIPEPEGDCVVASVRNPRADSSTTVQMALSAPTGPPGQMKSYYQAFVRVLDSRALDANGDPLYTSSDGPLCTAYPAGVAYADSAAVLARHDDVLTVAVEGAGVLSVRVDGEGPDVLDITPEDLDYVRSRDLAYTFTVRDDDSGLRHDGELVVTEDGDYTEVNADGDHETGGEPLSMSSDSPISVNGNAAEIDVMVWGKDAHVDTAEDVTHTGRWTLVGSRAGVAYAFSADGGSMDEGPYYMEITTRDRAGNRTVSDSIDDDGQQPHLFVIDDTPPTATEAWTGISYDLEFMKGGREIVDRSWIMVDFQEPLRRSVTQDLIRVAGHEVVSVIHPPEAPLPERTVLGRDGANNAPAGPQRLAFGPPAPRTAPQFAPRQQACTPPASDAKIPSLRFNYNETTGAASISWGRLSAHDCNGYRVAILAERTVLVVEDLERTASSYSIPRGSQLGRAIEAEIKDGDDDNLTILVGLRYASAGTATDNFGSAMATGNVSPHTLTPPSTPVSGTVTGPYLLHPPSAPKVLPAIRADDASLDCRLTSATPPSDEVVFSFTHNELVDGDWTRVGYYRQLFYPPDFDVDLGRLFGYTAIADDVAGGDNHESSSSYQGYYTWDTDDTPQFNAQGQVVAVYENSSGRRLAGAVRTLWCSATSVTDPDVDNTPPVLRRAEVGGATLTLTYNERLDGSSTPATGAFDLSVDFVQRTITNVSVNGSTVVLTLGSPVTAGERVTLTYNKPNTNPIQDLAGNDALGFTLWPVSNVLQGLSYSFSTFNDVDNNGGGYIDVDGRTHEEALAEAGYWPIDINGELIPDVRSRIYIELARELKADETPEVLLFGGGVSDLAGNPNESQNKGTRDGIAPRFTITVTATAQDRPVANNLGEFIVDVRADEDLRRRPEAYFTGIETTTVRRSGAEAYDYSIDGIERGGSLVTQDSPQHWSRTYDASELSVLGELFGLVVYGYDAEGNIGESGGWRPDRHQRRPEPATTPASADALNLAKMHEAGVLLELDDEFNGGATPEFTLNPTRRQRNNETESSAPIISISFPAEEDEYAVCPENGCGEANDNPDAEFSDSHARVTIAAVTLDDNDALAQLARVNASKFALLASDLPLGEHEVEYMAVDDAGNVATFEFTFSVVERTPYELTLTPGWNLISVPGMPLEPSLDAVIPPETRVSPVLSYQNGDWVAATKGEDGEWRGNLTSIEAGFGYWVFTQTFATLTTLIPEYDPASTPPAVEVDYGWNLVGVIDLFQNPAGTAPGAYGGGSGEADEYFSSIPWRVAYTYDSLRSRWVRTTQGGDADGEELEIANGKGYWVWSAEPGTLVP